MKEKIVQVTKNTFNTENINTNIWYPTKVPLKGKCPLHQHKQEKWTKSLSKEFWSWRENTKANKLRKIKFKNVYHLLQKTWRDQKKKEKLENN